MIKRPSNPSPDRDRGALLPLVLVATVVFTMVVGAVAGLVVTPP